MNEVSKQPRSQRGSGCNSNSSSYNLKRWGGETPHEEPWRGCETKEACVDRAKTRINNFDKRWDQSLWRWNCCSCSFGGNSYTYDQECPMCRVQRCIRCLVYKVS